MQPNCYSRELYKGVLDGSSHGVFNGKVYVHPDAQKTDGKQTNNTLLLSERAPANVLRVTIKNATPECRMVSKHSRETVLSYLKHDSLMTSEKITLNIGPGKTKDMKNLFKECGNVLKLCVDLEENADVVGDVRYLPFQENTIDFLFVIAVLEHVDDPAKAVKDIFRV